MKKCKIENCLEKHRALGFCKKHYKQNYFKINKEKIYKNPKRKKIRRNYYLNNKTKENLQSKKWIENNREYNKLRHKVYASKNKEKINKRHNLYDKIKRKEDPVYNLKRTLRSRLYTAIKSRYKSGSAVKDLGCSIEFLKQYLESQFKLGMTWENYGVHGWHIDHIKPLSSFDLTNRFQLLKACHYTNLQPLWAIDNLLKSDN